MIHLRYSPPCAEGTENPELYEPGGYHPIYIGDTFDDGRYRILHKLGQGGFSTVWLARDQWEGKDRGKIVALKAMCSEFSSSTTQSEIPELAITTKLMTSFPESLDFLTVEHHFFVEGPNGSHLFLVLPFAGPNIRSCLEGRGFGSRRLRTDLARKVAKQVAKALYDMHSVGIVHGDLTTSNILFRLSPRVITWSDAEVYAHLDDPETEELDTIDGTPLGPHAPREIVVPIAPHQMSGSGFIQDSVVVSDFGQSYDLSSPPESYEPGTRMNYLSPETQFEDRAGPEADIWALGCTIFDIRAGFPLFEPSFFGSQDTDYVLRQMVQMLGRLPDPWWGAFEERGRWFEEDGQLKPESGETYGYTSIRESLLSIGHVGTPLPHADWPMLGKFGVQLPEEEVDLLEDLLQKMMKYAPEERICIQDVIEHPWFMFSS